MKKILSALILIFLIACSQRGKLAEDTIYNIVTEEISIRGVKNKEESMYKNNMKHGVHKIYYPENQLMYKSMYLDDNEQGYAYWYYRDGRIAVSAKYHKGQIESEINEVIEDYIPSNEYRILEAVKENNIEKIERLLENGNDINEIDQKGFTPLILAIKIKNIEIVRYLIKNGADPNFFYERDRLILGSHGEVQKIDVMNLSPLIVAGIVGDLEIIEILLRSGASFEKETIEEKNVFHYALEAGNKEVLKFILNNL